MKNKVPQLLGTVWAGLEFLVVVTLGTATGVGLGLLLHGG